MDSQRLERFRRFVSDERPAIDELMDFVGGEVQRKLDGTVQSLWLLDRYIAELTKEPNWSSSSLFEGLDPGTVKSWLKVRVAYYLGRCLRNRYGCEWSLCNDSTSAVYRTPVMVVFGVELSPLEVADAYVEGRLKNGLQGLVKSLDHEIGAGESEI